MTTRLALGAISLAALAVLAACGGGGPDAPPAPSTSETSRVIAFGDSLSDGGTYSRANSLILQSQAGVPAAAANLVGKFTNSPGDLWVESLAKKLGTTIAPERFEVGAANPLAAATNATNTAANANNYSQGGSRVAKVPGIGCTPNAAGACTQNAATPVSAQVDRALGKGRFNATDVVVVWAGANDVFHNLAAANADLTATGTALGRALTATEQQAVVGKYVIEMETAALSALEQVRRLQANGAQRVVLMTIPNAAQSPFGVQAGAAARGLITVLADAFNNQLKKEVQLQDPGVLMFDAGALSANWYTNPSAAGFVNVQMPVCNVPASLGSSSSFCFAIPGSPFLSPLPTGVTQANSLFADGVHPSLAAHDKFGTAVYDALKAKGWVR